jgi:hypothetical protein
MPRVCGAPSNPCTPVGYWVARLKRAMTTRSVAAILRIGLADAKSYVVFGFALQASIVPIAVVASALVL